MAFEIRVTRRVEFSETDMAGIMHFSNFFRFMETAEHAFLRSIGFSVVLTRVDSLLCLPRVHASCDYKAPLRFEDEVEIHLLVARKSRRTLGYHFCFSRKDGGVLREVARGLLTVVCASRQADGTLKAAALPPLLADKIEVAPAALLHPDHRSGTAPLPGSSRREKALENAWVPSKD
jgi:acyl-CoA thioester hydrolase